MQTCFVYFQEIEQLTIYGPEEEVERVGTINESRSVRVFTYNTVLCEALSSCLSLLEQARIVYQGHCVGVTKDLHVSRVAYQG